MSRVSEREGGVSSRLTRRSVLGAASSIAGLGLVTGRAFSQASTGPIKIGVSAALTANFAQNGLWMKNGISLAAKQINDRGGVKGRQIALYVEDDQGPNPTASANAVTKLLTQSEVVALIGPHFTPAILPNEPALLKYKVPALTGASGPVVTQQNNPYVFRVRLNDAVGAGLLVKFVVERKGWKKIGLAYVNTAFGQSGIGAVKDALTARNITPLIIESHQDSTKDFTSSLLKFQEAGVDGIIVWTDDQPSGLLTKQMKTLGMKYGLAGSTTFSQPPFLALAGDAAEGTISVSDFTKANPDPVITEWKKTYAAVYGEEPELYASTYYDAMNLIADAIGRATEVSGPAIQQALTTISDKRGVMTSYTWSKTGDMVHSGLITVVKDGKPVIAEVIKE